MRIRSMINGSIAVVFGLTLLTVCACDEETQANNNNGVDPDAAVVPICVEDGVCTGFENCANCPDDCCSPCDPTLHGTDAHDVIVEQLFLPTTAAEAADTGIDLNGDGAIDNKVGAIIAAVAGMDGAFTEDINAEINEELALGEPLIIGRITQTDNGQLVAVQLLPGASAGSPAFDGNDEVWFAPNIDQIEEQHVCAEWATSSFSLDSTPATLSLAFPLPDMDGAAVLELERAQVITVSGTSSPFASTSMVSDAGWADVMVGGGLTQYTVDNDLLPYLARFMNTYIETHPGGASAETMLSLVDGACDPGVVRCGFVVPGDGDCQTDGVITTLELRCNDILSGLVAPDIDSDDDGEADLLSVGLRIVSAVPATVVTTP